MSQYSRYADADGDVMMCGWGEGDIVAGFSPNTSLSPASENCGRQEGADTPLDLNTQMDVDSHWCHADAHEDSQEWKARDDAPLELVVEMDLDAHQPATQEADDMQVGHLIAKMASLEIVDDMDLDSDSEESTHEQSDGWLSPEPSHTW